MIEEQFKIKKSFIVNRSDLEGRLEPEYYHPSIKNIEDKIRSRSNKKLKDFIVSMASGATPSVQELEKYYSDEENGYPFLRVQNLQTNGKINLNQIKYINKKTHENYLKRSQVKGGDLLVKITGVGRMAIASVPPQNFEGNSNQHMVVIKTENDQLSEYLSKYLNLDLVEKLASRRATGGTRPALDYPALKSIPVIENIDFSFLESAQMEKKEKELQARELLSSIDTYLLNELGIKIPEKENTLESRVFITSFSEISGGRFDPLPYDERTKALKNALLSVDSERFKTIKLKDFILQSIAGDWGIEIDEALEEYNTCLVIRATEFDNDFNLNLDDSRVKSRSVKAEKLKKLDIKSNDILIEKSGGSIDQPVGRVAILTEKHFEKHRICFSNFIHKIRVDENYLNPYYVFSFLKMTHNSKLTESMQSQTNGIRNLIMSNFLNQNIVVPINQDGTIDLMRQERIASRILEMRNNASILLKEGESLLKNAEKQIEKIILGK